jgi:excisionase family DNA binding protein
MFYYFGGGNMEKLLDIKDVMTILKIGRNSVYNLMNSGDLKSFKVGGAVRFKARTVEEYVTKVEKEGL